jgi:hypothetical protein
VGVNQAQAANDPFSERVISKFRNCQPFFITDDDVFNIAGAVDENADLATEIVGDFDETGGQFLRAEFGDRYPPAVEAFQRLNLA